MKSPAAIQIGALLLAGGLLLTGCSGESAPSASTTPSTAPEVSTSASSPATSSPTSTLTAEEQQAFEEATEAVRAYEQMFYDILADPQPNLNDMNNVAAQPQLALDLEGLQQIFSAGETSITATGPVAIAFTEPIDVAQGGEPQTVVLVACVDRSANSGIESGKPWTGLREKAQYEVLKTTYLPSPGWAVARVQPPVGFNQPQPC